MKLDFIQNLKSLSKIRWKFQWVPSLTHKSKQTTQDKEKPRYKLHKRTWNTGKTLKQALQRNQMTYLQSWLFQLTHLLFFAYQSHGNFLYLIKIIFSAYRFILTIFLFKRKSFLSFKKLAIFFCFNVNFKRSGWKFSLNN